MAHTPGEWTLIRWPSGALAEIQAPCMEHSNCHKTIAFVSGNNHPVRCSNGPNTDANVHLMAAAPDLLAALKAIRDGVDDDPSAADHVECFRYERTGSDNTDVDEVDQRCALCRAADAAIAKAEGE